MLPTAPFWLASFRSSAVSSYCICFAIALCTRRPIDRARGGYSAV